MNPIVKSICLFTKSSIGRKMIVAVTGVVLFLFLAGHMVGNMTVFLGPDALNAYAHHLQSLPKVLLWAIRLCLLAFIGIHIILTLKLKQENLAARQQYEFKNTMKATLSSRTMVVTGLMILCFVIFHLEHFTARFGLDALSMTSLPGLEEQVPNVYAMVVTGFQNPLISAVYILGMILIFSHLKHGVQSVFQTVGLSTKKLGVVWNIFSILYATVICVGYISIPAAVLLGLVNLK